MRNTDQYNNPIPQDLILLNPFSDIDFIERELKEIEGLNWYCFEGNKTNHIFVSCSQLEKVLDCICDEENTPDDISVGKNWNLVIIDDVLKRFNVEDGFYHS